MSKKEKLRNIFLKKSKIETNDNNIEFNKNNIQEKIDEINLKKLQQISKYKYNENIKNNMINYIKNNDNINLEYEEWIKQFNELDYKNEFVDEIRNNKIYHEIWNNLTEAYNDFEILY